MHRVGEFSTLNANYMMKKAQDAGFNWRIHVGARHEFIVTLSKQNKELHVSAMDFAKRLLDYGYHAPTTYFPLLVPECWLIEPTETEEGRAGWICKCHGADSGRGRENPEFVRGAPTISPLARLMT